MPSRTTNPGYSMHQLAASLQALAKTDPVAAKAKCAFLLRHGEFVGGAYKWIRTGGGEAILYKRCRHCGHVELTHYEGVRDSHDQPLPRVVFRPPPPPGPPAKPRPGSSYDSAT